jgi:lipoprotein signal peptidase
VLYLFASGGGLFLLDQWSKSIVQWRIQGRCVRWGPVVRIHCLKSVTVFYRREGARAALVMIWLAALVSAVLLHRSGIWFQSPTALLALGTALGGAAGNLCDILRQHYVVDFIDLQWWPVFNLADVAIIAGLATALWPAI